MRNYVIINGVNSLTIQGLAIKTMPPITKPIQRNLREEIDGRDGDIVTTLGYGAYDKTIEIGLFGTFDIDEVIAFFNQKGTITFSNEADKVYYFEALDQVDYAELLKFRTANVVLHCQPFKYPLTDTPVDVAYDYVESIGENITLDNTEASLLKIDLKGQTNQDTTTGTNLIDTRGGATLTDNGITFTPTYNSKGDLESIKVNGTASAMTTYQFPNYVTLKAGTYYISKGGTNNVYMLIVDSGGSSYVTTKDSESSFTLSADKSVKLYLRVMSGTAITNAILYPMVATTSGATYEPYTYGASPNPNYPQPVKIVSGDNSINVCGKNLVEGHINGYAIGSNGRFASNSDFDMHIAKVIQSETYTATTNEELFVAGFFTEYPTINSTSYNGSRITQTSKTFTAPITGYIAFRSSSGYQFAQCEVGSSASTYEPYIGNTYPIYLGVENLLDLSQFTTQEQDGITFIKNSDGSITINGTATNNITLRTPITPITLQGGTTYTLSKGTTYLGANYSMSLRKQDQTFIDNTSMDSSASSVSFTPSSGVQAYYFQIYIVNGKTFNNHKVYPMVEKGSKANNYTPYGTTPIELCKIGDYQDSIYKGVGSNLFDGLFYSGVLNTGVDYTNTDINRTLTYSDLNGSKYFTLGGYFTAGTYTLSVNKNGYYISTNRIAIAGTNNAGNTQHLRNSYTWTQNVDGYTYIGIERDAGVTDYTDTNFDTTDLMIQINEGSTPLPYEPYNSKDKWLLHKEIGEVVLDGSESGWNAFKQDNNIYSYYKSIPTAKTNYTGAYNVYNYFKWASGLQALNSGYASIGGATATKNGNFIFCVGDTTNELASFKTWLSTHNTEVYYVLATPTTTLIEDTTLLEQLNAIQNAVSYSGQTNITQENSDKPFMIDATALKKGSDNAVLNNIGNIYSKPVIALKGTGIVNIYNDGVQSFQVDMSEENDITIDTEMMEAYTPTKLANRQVTGDYSKFMIDTGSHDVKFDGELTEATITRYVRWL